MTKDEALKLALQALEYRGVGSWRKKQPAIIAIKQALANDALEKKAENARELGLDYEQPETCGHCNGSGRMVRDPDIGTDQECFVCEGKGYFEPEQLAPVQQEPVAWMEMVVANLVREGVNKHKARELAQHFYTSPPQRTWVGLTDDRSHQILLDMAKHIETFGDESTTEQALSAECIRFILERVTAHGIKEKA